MMVNNLFGDRWSYLEPNAYLWIFAGLVARLNVISQNPQEIKQINPKEVQSIPQKDDQMLKKKARYYDPQESV